MKLILLLCCLIFICEAIFDKDKGVQEKAFVEGVEFNKISRSALLKILSAFEENIYKNLRQKKLKPIFTAQFANNKYTKPYIYPNVFEKAKGEVLPSLNN